MKVIEILKTKKTISFEVFPPKNKDGDITSIYETIAQLSELKPDFISVTYGAGGSTIGKTVQIANVIKNKYGIESVAHLTCISSNEEEIERYCNELKEKNIDNILALRGDIPLDDSIQKQSSFTFAKDLAQFIHQKFPHQFCITGACYPEGHQDAECLEKDLLALKEKVEAGAEYLITQIFYDNNYYYNLVKEARKIGINVPIIAGIMPAINSKQLLRTTKLCGCSIPYLLSSKIQKFYNYPKIMKEIGVHYAIDQIIDLIANGVDGIHIYTMNRPDIAQSIFSNIPNVLADFTKK